MKFTAALTVAFLLLSAACTPIFYRTRVSAKEEFNKFQETYKVKSEDNWIEKASAGFLRLDFTYEFSKKDNKESLNAFIMTVDGPGLRNNGKLWITADGERMTFDIGEPYRDESVSVWSYGSSVSTIRTTYEAVGFPITLEQIQRVARAQKVQVEIECISKGLEANFSKLNFQAVQNFLLKVDQLKQRIGIEAKS